MVIKWVGESEEECKKELDRKAAEEFNKDHPWLGKNVFEETVKHVFPKEGEIIEEWGGTLRCNTSDGRNVNIADELNK
jgi:hypothetical protein